MKKNILEWSGVLIAILYSLNSLNSYVILSWPITYENPIYAKITVVIIKHVAINNENFDNLKDFPRPSFSDVKNIL